MKEYKDGSWVITAEEMDKIFRLCVNVNAQVENSAIANSAKAIMNEILTADSRLAKESK